jgi:hypothetical protein
MEKRWMRNLMRLIFFSFFSYFSSSHPFTIDNDLPLLTANSDQFLEWDAQKYVDDGLQHDGAISTFIKDEPDLKWSYAKTNEKGFITLIREKEQISNIATTGIYLWSKGSDFVKHSKAMISKVDVVILVARIPLLCSISSFFFYFFITRSPSHFSSKRTFESMENSM